MDSGVGRTPPNRSYDSSTADSPMGVTKTGNFVFSRKSFTSVDSEGRIRPL